MTIVAIQVIVLYEGENPPPYVMEQQTLHSDVLAPTMPTSYWAHEEITEGGLAGEAFIKLKNDNYAPGVYSLIGLFRLSSGKHSDTPNGPGEWWAKCEPVSECTVERLGLEETQQYLQEDVEFIKEDLDYYFHGEEKKPITFLFDTGKDNDENAPHSQG